MEPAEQIDVANGALDALPKAIEDWRAALRQVTAKTGVHDWKGAAGATDDALKAARKVSLIVDSALDATTHVRGSLPLTPPANRWAKA